MLFRLIQYRAWRVEPLAWSLGLRLAWVLPVLAFLWLAVFWALGEGRGAT